MPGDDDQEEEIQRILEEPLHLKKHRQINF
jgi:hypothetical protein